MHVVDHVNTQKWTYVMMILMMDYLTDMMRGTRWEH